VILVAHRQGKREEYQPDIAQNRQKIAPDRRVLEHIAHHDGVDGEGHHQKQQHRAEGRQQHPDGAVEEFCCG
jgi:hypothetical protein